MGNNKVPQDLKRYLKKLVSGIEIGPFEEILAIPDLHAPFIHKPSITKLLELIELLKPKHIVCLGDDYDFYAFSSFPKSYIGMDYRQEVIEARKQLEEIWRQVRKLSPRSHYYNLLGNHNMRVKKRASDSPSPEIEMFLDVDRWFAFDGVQLIKDPREPLMIGNVACIHGFTQPGKHRLKLGTHVIHGHTHQGGYKLDKINGRFLFELDAGYLGDASAKCFNYTPVKELKWTRGCGFVGRWGGHFLPFE